ncbi:MAG: ribosome maturation factor RimP [Bryobacterales bacterium]|nr:ribosome maturation factor RimP [Bryobacterales bacterium]
MRSDLTARIEEIATRVAASEGIEIVEVELKGAGAHRMLRISIDRPEGVTHGDCELISHQVGTILDVEDVIPGGRYTLEVSSPGVERKLTKPGDFERFAGQKAKVVLREPEEGRKSWEGVLAGFREGRILLEVAPDRTLEFPLESVERANLKFEWGTRS